MSRPRKLTAEQDKQLADWWWQLQQAGTVRDKAREYGISMHAVYDAISRGLHQPTAGERFKLREYERSVSRETEHNEPNGEAA
jgi:hypothetical protein